MDTTQRKSFKLFVIASGIIFAFLFFISFHDSAFGASLTDIHFLSNSQYEIISDTAGQLDIVTTSTTGGAINISSRAGSGIFVNSSNFVGIGTTTPATALSVAGTITATTINAVSSITGTFTGTNSGATLATAVRGNGSVFGSSYDAAGTNYRFNDAANAALFYVDATNSRVGVGTASPGAKLDVQGIGFFGITNKLKIQESGNAMSIQATLATDDNAKKDIAISAWGGNVGIGTAAPSQKLHVNGNLLVDSFARGDNSGIFFRDGFTHNVSLTVRDWGSNNVSSDGLLMSGYDGIGFMTSVDTYNAANVRMFIQGGGGATAGNVGIGTTAPAYKLDVNGDMRFGTTMYATVANPYLSFSSYFVAPGGAYFSGGYVYTEAAIQARGGIHNDTAAYLSITGGTSGYTYFSGNVGIGTMAPSAKLHIISPLTAVGVSDLLNVGHDINWNLKIQEDWYSGGIRYNLIQQAGTGSGNTFNVLSFNSGNVGIGNIAPAYKLDVTGDINFTGTLRQNGVAFSSGGQWTTSGTNIYNSNTGNVGVGTASPGQKLDVSGNMAISGSAGNSFYLWTNNDVNWRVGMNNTDAIVGFARALATSHVDYLSFASGAGQGFAVGDKVSGLSSFEVTGSGSSYNAYFRGNVGIGTPSPTYKLTVAGTLSADSGNFYTDGLGNINATSFYDRDNAVYFLDPSAAVSMKTAGSVGIGMTGTPSAPLEVNGGTGMTSGWNRTAMLTATFPTLVFNSNNTNWAGIAYDYSSNLMIRVGATSNDVFGTGVTAIAITQTGNVGIGTAAPGANKLYVNGAALINGALSMNSNNITSVNKLTVLAIDPLYNIGGTNYATYGPSIAGGVKEEYVGRGKLGRTNNLELTTDNADGYTYIIDLSKAEKGSDAWVWYNAVDFSRDNVEVFATPYGIPTAIAFEIEGTKIIFRGEKAVEFSYRLIGKRHDWKDWPTYAKDQNEKPSFTLEAK